MHARARTKGVNPIVYWLMRAWLQPFAHIYWRLSRIGREHVPTERSGDLRLQPPLVHRPVHHRPLQPPAGVLRGQGGAVPATGSLGWFLSSLGAFPVRRGAADGDMIETAKAILKRGDPVLIFPEGTRTRPGALGKPKRGVGRLALETGATVVPVAIKGTEAIRKGFRIRPHKVRVRIGAPLNFPQGRVGDGPLAAAVTDRIWPNVMLQWEWLGGLPPLRRAAVIGGGSWGTAVAVVLARAGIDVELGMPHPRAGRADDRHAPNEHYLPGVELPARCTRSRRPSSSSAATTSSRSPSPRPSCPRSSPSMARASPSAQASSSSPRAWCRRSARFPPRYVAERTRRLGHGRPGRPRPRRGRARRRRQPRPGREGRRLRPPGRRRALRRQAARRPHDRRHRRRARRRAKNAAALAAAAASPARRQRRRGGCGQGLRRDRRVRARLRLQARDVRGPGGNGRPRRDRAGRGPPQPARGRAARAGHARRSRSAPRSARPPRPSRPCRCSPPASSRPASTRRCSRAWPGSSRATVDPERWTQSLTAPKPAGRKAAKAA